MKSKLIVLSVDALVREDIDHLKTLPNFKQYMSDCSEIRSIRTIYPTITYPVHTSIATGAYPNKHGIYCNMQKTMMQNTSMNWQWFHNAVKTTDIFTASKKAGLTTAAVFWPVTGNHPHIDYLIDEYWTQGEGDTLHEAFKRSGSSDEVLDIVNMFEPIMVERTHPMCDNFIINCACEIIARHSPDLMMIHPANIDSYRHQYGLFNEKVTDGIVETDRWIGQLVEATKRAGIYNNTNFVVISDHGLININRCINLNVILADNGLIKTDEKGNVSDWCAFIRSEGTCAFVHLKNPSDDNIWKKTYNLLKHMKDEGIYGIEKVFTTEEINEIEHLNGNFSFVLETDGYTSFGDSVTRPLVKNFDISDFRYGVAAHGHLPDKGPQPVFMAKGPSFKENVIIDRRPIVDEAPTFAKILGIELPDADGVAIDEILKK